MINMIVAVDEQNGIGKNNQLLAHIKADLEYFKSVTYNKTVVMGYNTYLSLPKKPLPHRRNIVITSKDITLQGCEVIHNIEELFSITTEDEEIFICGGASIYKQYMQYAQYLYITQIFHTFDADTFFPEVDYDKWSLESSNVVPQFNIGEYNLQFKIYKRL